MSDEKKAAAPAEKKEPMVSIMNRGAGAYRTSVGLLAAGQVLEVPAGEAKKLLHYRDLMDASKFVKNPTLLDLQAENAKLKAENAEMKALLDEDKGKGKK
jgi:cell division protein FtsB